MKDAVEIKYQVVNASTTATHGAGNDYTLTPALTPTGVAPFIFKGAVTLPAGSQSTDLTVNVLQDLLLEGTENVTIELISIAAVGPTTVDASQLQFNSTPATVQILDDENPTFTITGKSVNEGSGGASANLFTVSLSEKIMTGAVTLKVSFASGTAIAGSDFNGAFQTITFPAGNNTSQTISVPSVGDSTVELDETLTATLSLVSGPAEPFTVDATPATATILNDDSVVKIVPVATVTEGIRRPMCSSLSR